MLKAKKGAAGKSVSITQPAELFRHHQLTFDDQDIESILKNYRSGFKRSAPKENSKVCPDGMTYDNFCSGNVKKRALYQYPCKKISDESIQCYDTDGRYFVYPSYLNQHFQFPQEKERGEYRQALSMYLSDNQHLLKPVLKVYNTIDKMVSAIKNNKLKITLPSNSWSNLGENLYYILNIIKEHEIHRMHLKEKQLADSIQKKRQDQEREYRASLRKRRLPLKAELLPFKRSNSPQGQEF